MTDISFHLTGEELWQRMNRAVEKIRERLELTIRVLEQAAIPYAIIGGNAVRAWVAQVDESAVRTTCDVDILIRRDDWPVAKLAMEKAGFFHYRSTHVEVFLDSPASKPRDAVEFIFAGEKILPEHLLPAPDISEIEVLEDCQTLTLHALVRMKLTSFRTKDCMHLHDMINVGLIDESWCDRLPPDLAARLKELLDDPSERESLDDTNR